MILDWRHKRFGSGAASIVQYGAAVVLLSNLAPSLQVWQIPVEVAEQASSPTALVYQTPVEVLEQGSSPNARVFQIAVEVVYPFRCADIPSPSPDTGQTPAEECGIAGFVGAADVLIAKTGSLDTPVAKAGAADVTVADTGRDSTTNARTGAADVNRSYFGRDRHEP